MRTHPKAVRRAVSDLTREQLVDLVVELSQGCPCDFTRCAVVFRDLERQGRGQTEMQLP